MRVNNVNRIREILRIKQDTLAFDLGLSQQVISALEQKEKIDDKIFEDVARILKVPADAIRNMTDEAGVNYINSFMMIAKEILIINAISIHLINL